MTMTLCVCMCVRVSVLDLTTAVQAVLSSMKRSAPYARSTLLCLSWVNTAQQEGASCRPERKQQNLINKAQNQEKENQPFLFTCADYSIPKFPSGLIKYPSIYLSMKHGFVHSLVSDLPKSTQWPRGPDRSSSPVPVAHYQRISCLCELMAGTGRRSDLPGTSGSLRSFRSSMFVAKVTRNAPVIMAIPVP